MRLVCELKILLEVNVLFFKDWNDFLSFSESLYVLSGAMVALGMIKTGKQSLTQAVNNQFPTNHNRAGSNNVLEDYFK